MMASLLSPLDINPDAYLCISLDAEWNVSRCIGVSIIQIAPHDDLDTIFIIPVCVLLNSRHWLTCHSRFTSSTSCHHLFCNFWFLTMSSKLGHLSKVILHRSRNNSLNLPIRYHSILLIWRTIVFTVVLPQERSHEVWITFGEDHSDISQRMRIFARLRTGR